MARRKVIKTRTFLINIPLGIPMDKVYEKLSEALKTTYSEVKFEGNRLRIKLVGTEHDIKETWIQIRNSISELWDLYKFMRFSEASIETISKEIGGTFPPEALVYALRLKGYEAFITDNKVLKTKAPFNIVLDTARRIVEVLEETKFKVKGASAKKLIASLASAFNKNINEIIEIGIKTGVLGEDEDGRVLAKVEWRQGLRKLALLLGGANSLKKLGEGRHEQ
ncbi:MAG: DUF2067 family protein [Pyrodictiaceae archaeon]